MLGHVALRRNTISVFANLGQTVGPILVINHQNYGLNIRGQRPHMMADPQAVPSSEAGSHNPYQWNTAMLRRLSE